MSDHFSWTEWNHEVNSWLKSLGDEVAALKKWRLQMSAEMERVEADFGKLKGKIDDVVLPGVASLRDQVKQLKDQIAAGTSDTDALNALAVKMEDELTKIGGAFPDAAPDAPPETVGGT